MFVDGKTNEIIAIAQCKGKTHDFKLFKQTFRGAWEDILFLGDSGFQGILKLHKNSQTPIKSSKYHKLTVEECKYNRDLSRQRIAIEHNNACIKRFEILSYRYRNKRLRHGLRMSLICGVYNAGLS